MRNTESYFFKLSLGWIIEIALKTGKDAHCNSVAADSGIALRTAQCWVAQYRQFGIVIGKT